MTSGPNAGDTDTAHSNVDGFAQFQWIGDGKVGSDFVHAMYTDDFGGTRMSNLARMRWNDGLRVELESFTAERVKRGVLISWRTSFEVDPIGFRVIRESDKQKGGSTFELLTPGVIPARGSEQLGAGYEFLDARSDGSAGRYWLEDTDVFGNTTLHGPVEIGAEHQSRSIGRHVRESN